MSLRGSRWKELEEGVGKVEVMSCSNKELTLFQGKPFNIKMPESESICLFILFPLLKNKVIKVIKNLES